MYSVTCPAGTQVVGGGYYIVPDVFAKAKHQVFLGSYPDSASNAWTIQASIESNGNSNQSDRNYTINVYATCINVP